MFLEKNLSSNQPR